MNAALLKAFVALVPASVLFSGKTADEENRHASRVAALLAVSSTKHLTLEDFPVREVRCPTLMARANASGRHRNHRAKELRLSPHLQLLLQIVTEADQLAFM
jgi:hypothetical protein